MTTKTEFLELIAAYVDGETEDENMVNWCRLDAAIDVLFAQAGAAVPREVIANYVQTTDEAMGQAYIMFIEHVANGSGDLPFIRSVAQQFCEQSRARIAIGEYGEAPEAG